MIVLAIVAGVIAALVLLWIGYCWCLAPERGLVWPFRRPKRTGDDDKP